MAEVKMMRGDAREIRKTMRQLCRDIGPRPGGSKEEARARRWLQGRFGALGLARIRTEKFSFTNSNHSSCTGRWQAGGKAGRLDPRPMSYSPSTPRGGIEGEVVFLGGAARLHGRDEALRGKIGLFLGSPLPEPRFLSSLCNCGIAAAIILDDRTPSSWPVTLNFSESWASLVTLPMFSLPYMQGWDLARRRRVRVRIRAVCRRFTSTSGNVIAELPGSTEETIVVCAHLDSVIGSPGAKDDGSGIAAMLEVARLLVGRRRRRGVRFIGTGMEERLSVGAWNHVQEDDQRHVSLAVNFDSIGALLGLDQINVTGPPALARFAGKMAAVHGYDAEVKPLVTPYSDHFAFNMRGVPSLWFYRPSNASGDWSFHSAHDSLRNVCFEAPARAAGLTAAMIEEVAEAPSMPFERIIPKSMMRQVERNARWMYEVED